jgi:hypothetical protein
VALTEILYKEAAFRLGVCQNLVIPAWSTTPDVAHIRAFGRALGAVAAKYQRDFGVFDVVLGGKPSIDERTREVLIEVLRDPRFDGHIAAHVVMLPSFQGAAVRAFLNTVALVSRMRTTSRSFSELREAAAWMAPRLSQGGRETWTEEEVLAAQAEVTGPLAT